MIEFDHHCPESGRGLNMLASSCAARVTRKQGKCATCTSGIGYVKPVKKAVKKRGRKKIVRKRYCNCGAELEPLKRICEKCVAKSRKKTQAAYRRKQLLKKIEVYENRLIAYRAALKLPCYP